jgi:hypothetical protein
LYGVTYLSPLAKFAGEVDLARPIEREDAGAYVAMKR